MRTRPNHRSRPDGLRRAVVLACLGGLMGALAFSAPAFADADADLGVTVSTQEVQLTTGGPRVDLVVTITNNGPGAVTAPVLTIEVPLTDRGVTVTGATVPCSPVNGPAILDCPLQPINAPVGGPTSVAVRIQLAPPADGNDDADQKRDGKIRIANRNGNDNRGDNNEVSFTAVLAPKVQEVREISGTVVDSSTNALLDGAAVTITDSAGTEVSATTDSNGAFSYRAEGNGLKAGRIRVSATKEGYDGYKTSVSAVSGGKIDGIQLALNPSVAAPPSPSPVPSAAPSTAASADPSNVAAEADSGTSPWMVVLLSVIAATILAGGALWIGMRRNRDSEPGGRSGLLDSPTVQIDRPDLARNYQGYGAGQQGYPPGSATRVMPGATQVIPAAGAAPTQVYGAGPYQPASGNAPYQPASGNAPYQPASGAGSYQPASGSSGYGGAYEPLPAYPPPPPPAGAPGYAPYQQPPTPAPGYDAGPPTSAYSPADQTSAYAPPTEAYAPESYSYPPENYGPPTEAYTPPPSPTAYRSGPGAFAPEPIGPVGPADTALYGPPSAGPDGPPHERSTPASPGPFGSTPWESPNEPYPQDDAGPPNQWLHSVPPPEDDAGPGRHSRH